MEEVNRRRLVLGLRILLASVLLTAITLVVVYRKAIFSNASAGTALLDWTKSHPAAAAFAYIGIYIVGTVLCFPGSVMSLAAAVLFTMSIKPMGLGIFTAYMVVFFGSSIGAIAAFLLGRLLLREYIETVAQKYPIVQALDNVLSREGLKTVCLLRLTPVIPYNAVNYILGITSVKLKHYALGCFAMLPFMTAYILLGSSLSSLSEAFSSGNFSGNALILGLSIGGCILGLAGAIYISVLARREFNSLMEKQRVPNSPVAAEENDLRVSLSGDSEKPAE